MSSAVPPADADGPDTPGCVHLAAESVHSLLGEVVAHLCPDCDEQLPADFDPVKVLIVTGRMTINQARSLQGLPPVEVVSA